MNALILAAALEIFAGGLGGASAVLVLEDGTVLVSRPMTHDVVALRDRDGDGRVDEMRTALLGISKPTSLAANGNTLFIASADRILAAERKPDGSFGGPHEVADTGGTIGVGPDGKLYVASNDTLRQLTSNDYLRVYARGLRGLRGFAWHPKTLELWTTGEHRIADGLRYELDVPPSALLFDRDARPIEISKSKILRGGKDLVSPPNANLTGAALAKDGALLVSDASGVIYRIGEHPPAMTSSANELPPQPVLTNVLRVTLEHPTAVVHDEEQDVYFVAFAKGIARVSPEGKIESLEDGVRSARAMTIRGTELWVATGEKLHVFDRVTGAAKQIIEPQGAVGLSGLAVGRDDLVYVTDSDVRVKPNGVRERAGDGRIYRIEADGDAEVLMNGEELRSPSGIVWDDTRFLVAQSYGREIFSWSPDASPKAVLRGPGAFESLVVLPTGAVLVSSHHDDTIYFANGGGELRPLLSRASAPAGIGFDRKRNRLLAPSPDANSLEAWTLPPLDTPTTTDLTKTPPRALSLLMERRRPAG